MDRVCVHYWFMATSKNVYNPLNPGDGNLYELVEYAYLICTKCGAAKKTRIKDDTPENQ